MEPDIQSNQHGEAATNGALTPAPDQVLPMDATLLAPQPSFIQRVFIGDQGLRAGWSIALFIILLAVIGAALSFVVSALHLFGPRSKQFSVRTAFSGELLQLLSLIGAAWIVALIERRGLLDFNLAGQKRTANFFAGLAAGFLALSALVGALWAGHWLHFGPVALSGVAVARYAALWGITFLIVGLFEEGMFRCYLQFTFTRGINFWWAIGTEAIICLSLALRTNGDAAWGVYAIALLGLLPCLMLQLKRTPNAGFWQAAWVTSTLFGFIHTGNNGENWIGIFAAAAIGFVFCVSVWLTGSAWWAIGCHAGWDWGETYFYGTADSGTVAQGHYLSANPFGNAFWSGGTDGPEGSILVLGAILLLLVALLALYRPRKTADTVPAQTAG
jgi:hypothetical protein